MKLAHADVDRQSEVLGLAPARPRGELLAGSLQHPMAQRQDQAGVFGQRDELHRRHHAPLGVQPARQHLGTRELALRIDLRLVVKDKLPVLQTLTQIGLQLGPGVHGRLHGGFKKPQGVAPGGLGLVKRQVSPLEQGINAIRPTVSTASPRVAFFAFFPGSKQGNADAGTAVVLHAT